MPLDDLPQSDLIQLLEERAEQRHDTDFDFLARLRDFRRRVSDEVRFIHTLFPEYTPHDEQYHLKRLFSVTDTVLGRSRLEAFNASELFVLSAALYGHDWGMAVNEVEKQAILSGMVPDELQREGIALLPGEAERFIRFAKVRQLVVANGHVTGEVPIEIWREYVRETHAFRSGERARRYFSPYDGGVAEAVARVCEGHWLDFQRLQEPNAYPTDFAVLAQPVNTRALAVYLRLIDLLDLAEDRTPYVIWKFVAPRDPRSKMEWAKHRALQPVTAVPYQEGRILRIDGGSDDHEVYAALEDLQSWCDEQFRGCSDVLARMNDPCHKLDIFRIDWRLQARGFKPVSIQFDFDRGRMFEILSDEIYQGDPCVFLRELLQNSIDAIRLRRKVLERKRLASTDIGTIQVEVVPEAEGNVLIIWQDDGIGMDEYVIRNYLAVAGRSYYRSTDFSREGIQLDPISRFGVGLLSCFMVATHIEIETYRDPYFPPRAVPLRIKIPAVERRFRIEVLPEEEATVGTIVRVYVEAKLLRAEAAQDNHLEGVMASDHSWVTEYLASIAGFVEFPIVITQGHRKVLILHPGHDPAPFLEKLGGNLEVRQLDLSFPWGEAFLPQDLAHARSTFREERIDLARDLRLGGYEGVAAYVVPKEEWFEIAHWEREGTPEWSWSRMTDGWQYRFREKLKGIGRSGTHSRSFAFYKSGILVPEVRPYDTPYSQVRNMVPRPCTHVNLGERESARLDLSRTRLVSAGSWEKELRSAFLVHIKATYIDVALEMDIRQRCYYLGSVALHWGIEIAELFTVFPVAKLPVIVVCKGGQIEVLEWQELRTRILYAELLGTSRDVAMVLHLGSPRQWKLELKGIWERWNGDPLVVSYIPDYSAPPYKLATEWTRALLQRFHKLDGVRFLRAPWKGNPPLVQAIWLPTFSDDEQVLAPELPPELDRELLERVACDPSVHSLSEWRRLRVLINAYEFSEPFASAFSYAGEIFNLRHPVTMQLLQVRARMQLAALNGSCSRSDLGSLEDAMDAVLPVVRMHRQVMKEPRFREALARITKIAMRLGFVDGDQALSTQSDEFVPGSFSIEAMINTMSRRECLLFGKPLS